MKTRLIIFVVLGLLAVGLIGCTDMSMPDDVTKLQEQERANRGIPSATEMPPGLGEDLPAAPATQPMTLRQ